ncbi:unnamed protein product, partial [Prorocentrum cordatum]
MESDGEEAGEVCVFSLGDAICEDDEEDLEPGPTTKFELITLDDWEPAAQQAGGLRNEFSCEKIEPSADPENSRGPSTVSVYEAVHRVYWAKDDDHVDNDNDELM